MEINENIAIWICITLSFVIVMEALHITHQRFGLKRRDRLRRELRSKIVFAPEKTFKEKLSWRYSNSIIENAYIDACQLIDSEKINVFGYAYFKRSNLLKRRLKWLKSKNKNKRIKAAVLLGYITSEEILLALEKAFKIEKQENVIVFLAYAISQYKKKESINILVEKLTTISKLNKVRLFEIIASYEDLFFQKLDEFKNATNINIIELLIYFSRTYPSKELKDFLLEKSKDNKLYVAVKATKALAEKYHYFLNEDFYTSHESPAIRNEAIKTLSTVQTKSNLDKLINLLMVKGSSKQTVSSISSIVLNNPELLDYVVSKFHEYQYPKLKNTLTDVLSNRLEYFILRINSREKKYIKVLIHDIILQGKTSQLIGFLNKNTDEKLEDETIKVIGKVIYGKSNLQDVNRRFALDFLEFKLNDGLKEELIVKIQYKCDINYLQKLYKKHTVKKGNDIDIIEFLIKNHPHDEEVERVLSIVHRMALKLEFRTYLKTRILSKLNLEQHIPEKTKRNEKVEKQKIRFLRIILICVALSFPLVFLFLRFDLIKSASILETLKLYVFDFNYFLIFYSVAINSIYLGLLFFSLLGVRKQMFMWRAKTTTFLFKKNILPSISIIAPAYGEEETIIESVNSLLNINYPDYELIVVNDGSGDNTLNVLIDYFNLEKVDESVRERLQTQPIIGIYKNKAIGKLTVIDKANGGKADALNVGINVASKDFFCGIDSDSLLEPDALLKLASQVLDNEYETVAMGGNIFPINGCTVHKGTLDEKRIPTHPIAAFQTIEYTRAFMAGRIGWAYLKNLLIISGAFGLFNKRRVIEIGGYLTSKERYNKDTVGEDMELVVRISRYLRERKKKYSINYAFNANCWTEVPESFKILKSQRDRWQRGLIDILNFHRKILFNRKYGSMGTVSTPYFFIFELIGPLVEIKGYAMVILALILGMLSQKIALLLFASSILLGVLISLISLRVAEKDSHFFPLKDLFVLILYAIIENFGPRQLASFWRAKGYFSAMKKPKGWGEMIRKTKYNVVVRFIDKKKYNQIQKLVKKFGGNVIVAGDNKEAFEIMKKERITHFISDTNNDKMSINEIRNELTGHPGKESITYLMINNILDPNKNENITNVHLQRKEKENFKILKEYF